jgi:hypothetical protein
VQASRATVPLLPALLVVGTLLPAEFSLRLDSLLLNTPHLFLLMAFPMLLVRWVQVVARSKSQVSIADIAILPASVWMFLSVAMSQRALLQTSSSSVNA